MTNKEKTISLCSFSSGSSGNCYLIKTHNAAVLVDAGTTGKQMLEGLKKVKLEPHEIFGILITHEHYDHIRGISVFHNKIKEAPIYASQGTIGVMAEKLGSKIYDYELRPVSHFDGRFKIDEISIEPFPLSHDAAEPLGYTFTAGGKTIAILTDTGVVTEDAFKAIKEADLLVLEANYEERVLLMNRKYPYELKKRIMGRHGHLSNEDCANLISDIVKRRRKETPPKILLAHLSGENNTPANARVTVENLLTEKSLMEGREYFLDVLRRDEISKIFSI